ncbi:MAG TPA: response regulator transcription factor [Candidatus Dormibacteraeota bacterium]|nr:response regulator transcription factor [Candidatus Dormibacteraeota bacterium]
MRPIEGERGRVLIVEDAAESAEVMAAIVAQEGFVPVACATASEARASYSGGRPVAALLDWVLPDAPGTEVCRELRDLDAALVIIFISGRNDETSIVRGLDAGADDFVSKPVRPGELIARLEAQLRKVARLQATARNASEPAKTIRLGSLAIDLLSREVTVEGKAVQLGPLQYRLLEYLARNAGVAVSRDQILDEVYGIAADIGTERVDVLVQRLRRKLGDAAGEGGRIIAQPGYGYLLRAR